MKRLLLAITLALFVSAPLASAIPIEMDDINGFMKPVGLSVPGQAGKVTVHEGQIFKARIESIAFLAGKGLKDLKTGDAVEATYLGKNQWKFVHVPTGQQLLQGIKYDSVNKRSMVIEPGFN